MANNRTETGRKEPDYEALGRDALDRMAHARNLGHSPEEALLFGMFAVEPKPEEPMTPERGAKIIANEAKFRQKINAVLETLTANEREVIEKRYGLGGDRPLTVDEVAAYLHETSSVVQNIENSALKRLRDHKARVEEKKV